MAVMLLSRVRNFPVECIEKMYWIDLDNTSNTPLVENATHKAKPHPYGRREKLLQVRRDLAYKWFPDGRECTMCNCKAYEPWRNRHYHAAELDIKDAMTPLPENFHWRDFYRTGTGRRGPKWQKLAWAADKRG